MNQHVMPTYGRLPVSFVKGDGAYLEDTAGNKYLDALTGIAVCGLGHAHPKISQVISDQSQKLLHTSNLYDIPIQAKLAERLCKLSGMDNVFFCNSGAEANEAAIKIARLYGNQNSVKNPLILVAEAYRGISSSFRWVTSRSNVIDSIARCALSRIVPPGVS